MNESDLGDVPLGPLASSIGTAKYDFTERAWTAARGLLKPEDEFSRVADFVRMKHETMLLTLRSPNCRSTTLFLMRKEDIILAVAQSETSKSAACFFRLTEDGLLEISDAPKDVTERFGFGGLDKNKRAQLAQLSLCSLLYLNMPMMSQCETIDRANWKRIRRGQKPNRPQKLVTIVSPHASKLRHIEYIEDCEANDGIVPEKWWGGFWNFFWCGKHGAQWIEMRWIEGRSPKNKAPQYLVMGRNVSDPSARMKQLEQRRVAKERAQ